LGRTSFGLEVEANLRVENLLTEIHKMEAVPESRDSTYLDTRVGADICI
jgi:hypothetical protein